MASTSRTPRTPQPARNGTGFPTGSEQFPAVYEAVEGGLLAALTDDTVLPAGLRAQMTSDQLSGPQRTGMIEMVGPDESWGFMTFGALRDSTRQ